ncbi:Multidrug resistance protein MexA precursor [Marinomonas spartinae]|uniref:Multidrug resistance protein MexA n=1 Tax=Marinomonas spartinae TaxID=1792290 RepID=A0A1A8T8H3_9GAMM|nr:efflux RND transporter periplasmic adaptor subunit [Marinomonas spartinae]SBS27830.1 Multidrug resistance protein MexA precursor [Marinomonas spartinae]
MLSKFKYASGALLIALFVAGCQEKATAPSGSHQGEPKVEVGVLTIEPQKNVELNIELPGRTSSSLVAEIRPQVGGIIEKRLFKAGENVKAGQVLYQLDDSSYLSTVRQSQANLESANAGLKSAELKDRRYTLLRKQNNVSQQDLDDAHVAYLEAKATQKGAEAALQNARINLSHTKITSPISGRIGISQVTVGALVTANQAGVMTTVRSLNPVYVDLAQTSLEQLKLRNLLSQPGVKKGTNKVTLVLEDGSKYSHAGVLESSEINVDESTGSVTLRAVFPNPDNVLLPGMFVRGTIHQATFDAAILVPQQAVFHDVKGNAYAYLVNGNSKIEKRFITTERAIGNEWLVTKGINAGDKVVMQGSAKIHPGSSVTTVNVHFNRETDTVSPANAATNSSSN